MVAGTASRFSRTAEHHAVGIARKNGSGRKYTTTVTIIAIARYRSSFLGVGLAVSVPVESGSSRLSADAVVFVLVVIGFVILLSGGLAYYFGNPLLGEAMVLAGVFLFAMTFLCWLAARRKGPR
jgi:hypothetical protein